MNIKISIRGVINKGKERIIRNKSQLIWGSGKELVAAIWIILFKIERLTGGVDDLSIEVVNPFLKD